MFIKITLNESGIFFVDNTRIASEQDAEFFYMDYMERKPEKLSLVSYNSGILQKIKRFFNAIKLKFWKKEKAK